MNDDNVIQFRPRQPPPEPPCEPAPAPLSDADHALVLAVMADHGWSYEEARRRLELSGM